MEIEWTDTDPDTGERRYVCAEKFARKWRFKARFRRRTEWDRGVAVTREMWETLLDALERRYRRREGVSDEDLRLVRKELAAFRDAPAFDGGAEDISPQRHEGHTEGHQEDRRE
jgi:hypothetical protein